MRNFIASNPDTWLAQLVDTYKIIANVDGDLVSLKYNQIESPMDHPVVAQCRGMVVHIPSREIVAHPYDKFWNHGDLLAPEIDWSTARVQEKLDGSLMILYWDRWLHDWAVASSGTPRAGGSFGNTDITFRNAFWRTFHDLGMKKPDVGARAITFMSS